MAVKKYLLIFLLFSMLFSACKSDDSILFVNLPKMSCKTFSVKSDSININEIIKPFSFIKLQDFVVITGDGHKDLFLVYSFPEFKFLYSFGSKGAGPMDYLWPTIVYGTDVNKFYFYELSKQKLVFYNITKEKADYLGEKRLKITKGNVFHSLYYVNDSLCIVKEQNPKSTILSMINTNTGKKLHILPNTFTDELIKTLGKEYYSTFDDYCFIYEPSNNNFSKVYYLIDRIETGKTKNGKLFNKIAVGATKCPDFYLYSDDPDNFDVRKNIIYYETAYATPRHIYALYTKRTWGNETGAHIVDVFNWEGHRIRRLELDKNISNFFVDSTDSILCGFDITKDFDYIYKFKING